jgi:hypothetical protein
VKQKPKLSSNGGRVLHKYTTSALNYGLNQKVFREAGRGREPENLLTNLRLRLLGPLLLTALEHSVQKIKNTFYVFLLFGLFPSFIQF